MKMRTVHIVPFCIDCCDNHAARWRMVIVVVGRAVVDGRSASVLRPTLNLTTEEVCAVGRREAARTIAVSSLHHWAKVDRFVHDLTPCGLR
jgi:hypothetical protein